MGWERKRGKLDEFNRLLLGDAHDRLRGARRRRLRTSEAIRFVITLDADTALPQGAAARLVGTLAHPLNRAEFDPRVGTGSRGLHRRSAARRDVARERQPFAVHAPLLRRHRDRHLQPGGFGRLSGSLRRRDLRRQGASTTSRPSRASLAGRVPENALASHDLFEGIHGRAALATDIVLYEDYPPSYLGICAPAPPLGARRLAASALARRRVPGAPARLPAQSIRIDRPLEGHRQPPAQPAPLRPCCCCSSRAGPGCRGIRSSGRCSRSSPRPVTSSSTSQPAWSASDGGSRPHLSRTLSGRRTVAAPVSSSSPTRRPSTADAIVRTLIRVTLTKRHLLEWTTSAHAAASVAQRGIRSRSPGREMALAPLIAWVVGAALLR